MEVLCLTQLVRLARFRNDRPLSLSLAFELVSLQVLGSMGKTCEMGRAVVDSPLGKIEISGCEQGLHEIRLCGRKTLDPE